MLCGVSAMTINAALQRLVLSSPQPEAVASFYARAFDYRVTGETDELRCEGAHRSLWIQRGAVNQLVESRFMFADMESLERYVAGLKVLRVPHEYEKGAHAALLRV